jgi:hypothetical protein
MEYRCGQTSTIFYSQFTPEGWHERLGGSALADSILDRIVFMLVLSRCHPYFSFDYLVTSINYIPQISQDNI